MSCYVAGHNARVERRGGAQVEQDLGGWTCGRVRRAGGGTSASHSHSQENQVRVVGHVVNEPYARSGIQSSDAPLKSSCPSFVASSNCQSFETHWNSRPTKSRRRTRWLMRVGAKFDCYRYRSRTRSADVLRVQCASFHRVLERVQTFEPTLDH